MNFPFSTASSSESRFGLLFVGTLLVARRFERVVLENFNWTCWISLQMGKLCRLGATPRREMEFIESSYDYKTAAIAAATLAVGAALNIAAARRTERSAPALAGASWTSGRRACITPTKAVGPPVVLLHGNGVTARDWKSSGLIDALVGSHRVIAFDRPGFGYSTRPRAHVWTAAAQATLLHEALQRLAIGPAVVVGHSWGTLRGTRACA